MHMHMHMCMYMLYGRDGVMVCMVGPWTMHVALLARPADQDDQNKCSRPGAANEPNVRMKEATREGKQTADEW